MTATVYRYGIPVDDRAHELELSGAILHVDCRDPKVVEIWTLETGGPRTSRWFKVFGTGHDLPDLTDVTHCGTALAPGGALVWHLFEMPLPGSEVQS